jgi:hypothetical protein
MQKISIITDKAGKLIGSARTGKSKDGKIESGIVPLKGQSIQEMEVPSDVEKMESPDEIHKALDKLIKKK